jgi:hypothetical protein
LPATSLVRSEGCRGHARPQVAVLVEPAAGKPIASDLPGNEEIGRARVEYRRRK